MKRLALILAVLSGVGVAVIAGLLASDLTPAFWSPPDAWKNVLHVAYGIGLTGLLVIGGARPKVAAAGTLAGGLAVEVAQALAIGRVRWLDCGSDVLLDASGIAIALLLVRAARLRTEDP